jgi:AraC-like DNA-binding protein
VATWLAPDERLRVDAAGHDLYRTTHFDDAPALARALAAHGFDAALVSVTLLARTGRRAREALAPIVQTAAALPTLALVSEPVALPAVLALGRAGVRAVLDVQRPDGWTELRAALAATARSDVAQLAHRTLAPAVATATSDVQRFVAALFDAPARVVTVRDLARGLDVLPTTLMSRFFRVRLPPPKRYLALARLTRAAYLLRTPGWTVARVADHLEYSSAQGFSRHLHLLLGVRPAEFRRRYDAVAMLSHFDCELITPHLAVLRTFWPLRGTAPHPAPAPPPADP